MSAFCPSTNFAPFSLCPSLHSIPANNSFFFLLSSTFHRIPRTEIVFGQSLLNNWEENFSQPLHLANDHHHHYSHNYVNFQHNEQHNDDERSHPPKTILKPFRFFENRWKLWKIIALKWKNSFRFFSFPSILHCFFYCPSILVLFVFSFYLAIHLVPIIAFFISLMIKRGSERENEYLLEPEDTATGGSELFWIVLSSYGNVLS